MGLREYAGKRNFRSTTEPQGASARKSVTSKPRALSFVVQKHDATRLHYDFRLEMDGALKSWAVPKGFPVNTGDKRLAVQVEDHPLEYASFEGIIPQGNYGAGTVIVWDRGTFTVLDDEPLAGLDKGKLHVLLAGLKLKGEWALVRMKPRPGEDKPQWLLFKAKEAAPPFTWDQEHRSCVTDRTLQEVAGNEAAAVWESNRTDTDEAKSIAKKTPKKSGPDVEPMSPDKVSGTHRLAAKTSRPARSQKSGLLTSDELRAVPKAKAAFIEPMKALLTSNVPEGSEWLLELKFDGVRALAIKNDKSIQLISRAEKPLEGLSAIEADIAALPHDQLVLDGEVVALDDEGRSSFQLLQSRNMGGAVSLFMYVFDVLNVDGRDLRGLTLTRRKEIAQAVLANSGKSLRFSPALQTSAGALIEQLQKRGLEGLIAKKKNSTYESGKRTGSWLKYKWTQQQEFVVGGYTMPQGGRHYFGALAVGYYEKGDLLFAGKVGTGFSDKLLRDLSARFEKLEAGECPFANLPEKRTSRFGGGMTGAEMRRCRWLKPELVCQVRFAEWTRDNHLRQPAFLGLREDKSPKEVVREKPSVASV